MFTALGAIFFKDGFLSDPIPVSKAPHHSLMSTLGKLVPLYQAVPNIHLTLSVHRNRMILTLG